VPATFTNKSWAEATATGPITGLCSNGPRRDCVKGTLVYLLQTDTDDCRGVAQLAGPFESNAVSVHSDSTHNKFRAPLAWCHLFPEPISKSAIMKECVMTARLDNRFICPRQSFALPTYKGENQALVKARFEALVATWVAEAKESLAPKKAATEDRTDYRLYSI
jgi:hypothetical protein